MQPATTERRHLKRSSLDDTGSLIINILDVFSVCDAPAQNKLAAEQKALVLVAFKAEAAGKNS